MATLTKGHTFSGGETVTATKLNDLVDSATISGIVNDEIDAAAAIALSKLATGALPTGITVASANLVDGTIVNADVNASAAIAGTKIAPDFGAQNVVTTGTLGAGATTVGALAAAATTLSGNLTMGDNNIVAGTTTGVKVGTATTQKLAFYNATPIVQPAAAAQAAAAAQTQDSVTDSTGGSAGTTLAAITAGAAYDQNDMVAIKDAIASIAAQLAKIKTDVANIKTLQDAERTALVNLGLMKGAA